MTERNRKSYSLEMLEEWTREALESDNTPNEIYDAIIRTVTKSVDYHRACLNHSTRLLSLLEDNLDVSSRPDNVVSFNDYWSGNVAAKDFERALKRYGYEYTPESFKLDSPFLHGDINLDGPEDNS
jgi:hypothetical protein